MTRTSRTSGTSGTSGTGNDGTTPPQNQRFLRNSTSIDTATVTITTQIAG